MLGGVETSTQRDDLEGVFPRGSAPTGLSLLLVLLRVVEKEGEGKFKSRVGATVRLWAEEEEDVLALRGLAVRASWWVAS